MKKNMLEVPIHQISHKNIMIGSYDSTTSKFDVPKDYVGNMVL